MNFPIRALAIILAAALHLFAIGLSVPTRTIPLPSDFDVPISVAGNTERGIISFEFDLNFNADAINPRADCTTKVPGLHLDCNVWDDGDLHIRGYGVLPECGVIISIPFATYSRADNGDTSGLYFNNIEMTNAADEDVDVTTESGYVTLRAPKRK